VARRAEAASLLVILAVAASVRLIWLRWFPLEPESDFATFLDMATKIAHGQWRPDEYGWVYQGPGYPSLIAPVIALGGGLDLLRVVNVAAQLGMICGVWLLARSFFGLRGATVAGALAAILPGIWTYVPLLAAESVAMVLVTGVALLLTRPDPPWRSALTGLTVGVLAFTRPSFLPFVLLAALATYFLAKPHALRRVLWFGAGFLIVAAPIVVLNTTNDGPFLPAGAAGWQTWLVNNEHATGSWFDAAADDAYPFTGLVEGAETRAAQYKLGMQFVAANPIAAAEGLWLRYRLNWQSDLMGLNWTYDRAPEAWRNRVPLGHHLNDVAQLLYVLTLGMAAAAAVRQRARTDLLGPLILPLAYALAILAVAEGNARYHAMFLPLVCVLAGGLLAPVQHSASQTGRRSQPLVTAAHPAGTPTLRRRARWVMILPGVSLFAILAVTLWLMTSVSRNVWERIRFDLPPWLMIIVVVVPVTGCAVASIAGHWQRIISWASRPSWRWVIGAGLCIVLGTLPLWFVASSVERNLTDVAAVSPRGWERTVITSDRQEEALPLLVEASGTNPDVRQVSFPDAAVLQFDGTPDPGASVHLERTLTDLRVGEAYVFYLQVYDPAADGDPSERLSIALNGITVWERAPGRTEPAAWHYVRVDWTADASVLTLTVIREAGDHYRHDQTATPLVRTLHLYPRY
jgi:hypothetical protein